MTHLLPYVVILALSGCVTSSTDAPKPQEDTCDPATSPDDADCDGILAADDCDDNDPDATSLSEDEDCDGILDADDDDDDEACPAPVLAHVGLHAYDGSPNSFDSLDFSGFVGSALSFTGWVYVNSWTGEYNRVFDFGNANSTGDASQGMRLHRNQGNTLRVAFNSFETTDFEDYWELGTWIFVALTVDDAGLRTIYKDGLEFGAKTAITVSEITWPEDVNYFVARSNWGSTGETYEPNSDIQVFDLQWYDTVVTEDCIEQAMREAP